VVRHEKKGVIPMAEPQLHSEHGNEALRGTIVVVLFIALIILVIWVLVFLLFLSRY